MKNISTKNPIEVFSEIKKQFENVSSPEFNLSRQHILAKAEINSSNLQMDTANNFILNRQCDILTFFGSYLEEQTCIHIWRDTRKSS